jgi:hypothetical protein
MSRPKMIARMTFRLPEELEADLLREAHRRSCSANEVIVTALENEMSRMLTYRLNYYSDIHPLMVSSEGNRVQHGTTLSDTMRNRA